MKTQGKIQSLIVRHLLDHGVLDIILPDGILLEIGIVHEDKNGDKRKSDDYCYVSVEREGRKATLDSFNLGMSFPDDQELLLFEDHIFDEEGNPMRQVDVI